MKTTELSKLNKLYFGYEDLARVLGISQASARVTASRYVRQGLLLRVKRNLYVLKARLNRSRPGGTVSARKPWTITLLHFACNSAGLL